MKIIVLLNGNAGTPTIGDSDETTIHNAFAAFNQPVEIRHVPGPHLTATARSLATDFPNHIITAAGGDGTQSAVAAALANTPAIMGVLPMGTLNHFAKDLGLPLDIHAAARVIATGHPRPIDVAQLNDRAFINNSSIGLYPHVVHHRDELRQHFGHGKWYAMLKAVIVIFRRFPVVHIRMDVNGKNWRTTTPFVFVGNNQYHIEGLNIGQRPSLERGDLSLYFANRTGRLGMLRLAFRALIGRLRQDRDFNALSATELWIDTPRRQIHVAIDGEVQSFTPPLHYRILPKSLNVMLPASNT